MQSLHNKGVKTMRRHRTLTAVLASIVVLTTTALVFAHGGGLDSQGGHHNRKLGGYHFHRGPLTGQTFSSKSSAASALQAHRRDLSNKDENRRSRTDEPKKMKPLTVDDKLLVLVQLLEKKNVLERDEFEKAVKEFRKSKR